MFFVGSSFAGACGCTVDRKIATGPPKLVDQAGLEASWKL